MHPLLRINHLTASFGKPGNQLVAVDDISFTVNRGEIVAIVGESGSGKSVTSLSILQLVSDAHYPSGEILFADKGENPINLLGANSRLLQIIRGHKIAMIFQEPMSSLNPVMTCGQQVMESLQLHKKIPASLARKETIEWFSKVQLPQPEQMLKRYPHQLSGGQKQRVMIAMAMCCQPSLLICDEPTTALDVTVQKTILELIRSLQREQDMGVIFITHDLGVVAEIADRAIVMYKGKIVEQNEIHQILKSPVHPYTRGLLACRPALHRKGERLPIVSDFMDTDSAGAMSQKQAPEPSESILTSTLSIESSQPAEVLIRVKDLSVWYPGKKNLLGKPLEYTRAVDQVSFDVMKGETLGLVGESGCGKTTLGRTLLRLISPTHGSILYNNQDLAAMHSRQLKNLRKDIQLIFQDPYSSLNPRLSIGPAIAEPLKVHGIGSSDQDRRAIVTSLLEKVNLRADQYNRYPHEFSGGQRQRIVIARALALNPSFIVCDESVSALDVSVQAQVLNLLNDLKQEYGFTIIFISHDLSVVRYISDRIMVMQHGKIVETGEAEAIYHRPQTLYTQELIQAIPTGILD